MICLIILPMTPLRIEIDYPVEDFLGTIMFSMFLIAFAPQENSSEEGFPVEIFGFIYSIVFMFHSAGNFVIEVFYLSDHYYAYAIHDKIGMLSGQRHPHVHIMFSERLIDDVEKKKERAACNFFKYPIRKNVEATFEERRKHGAPKNRNWANKNFLSVLRADFAQIQNEVLKRNGFSIRVDHRTLQAQKEEAEKNGDSSLARLFSRVPEKYIGVISCQDYEKPRLERLKIFRGLRERHFDLLMKLERVGKVQK